MRNTTMQPLDSTLLVLIPFGKQGFRRLAFVVRASSLRDEHCSLLKERSHCNTPPFVLLAVQLFGLRGGSGCPGPMLVLQTDLACLQENQSSY